MAVLKFQSLYEVNIKQNKIRIVCAFWHTSVDNVVPFIFLPLLSFVLFDFLFFYLLQLGIILKKTGTINYTECLKETFIAFKFLKLIDQ